MYKNKYISVNEKFWLSHLFAFLWMVFSIVVSIPWLNDLASIVGKPIALLIIAGIGYIPGYINLFTLASLLLDRQPGFKTINPLDPVTIIIACRNEEKCIADTLYYIKKQDYEGEIHVIIVDNGSTDKTSDIALNTGRDLNLSFEILFEDNLGKYNALNKALEYVKTDYVITLDADTLLHKSAVRYIISRITSSPEDVCAVAGAVLVRNGRRNLVTRLQEWDYFLGIASIKRMQGLYQGTLVAQGAYSVYKTEALKIVGGWSNAIGEDIILTWNFLKEDMKVYFEPLAVAFTEVPTTLRHLYRQRSRWARGMIEALKIIMPWNHPIKYVRYLTGVNLVMPYLDIVYTFCWIPGLIFAFFGKFWIVGPMTLFVIPIALLQNYILYRYQSEVFKNLKLKIRKNHFGFILYVLTYQMLMSPMSLLGYIQEIFLLKRNWK
ncbi:glycosyltransferase family 2 protein [Anaerosalibacter sp. Marseille-P3206]|uniref:glycosyltransferase family 2 protein n=1 Tax=Anaerosalibacter sp. Marseille-P3206 TaxID=1871005 RepID=UPI000986F3B8|nr:glycosyltransferase [Anaerosalibacter sp. Marseille-P3206]